MSPLQSTVDYATKTREARVDTAAALRANCAAAVMELNRKHGSGFGFATVMKHAIEATLVDNLEATLLPPRTAEELQHEERTQFGAESLHECWELICHLVGEEEGVDRMGSIPAGGTPWRVATLPFGASPSGNVDVTPTLRST